MEIYENTTPTIHEYAAALEEMKQKWTELNDVWNATTRQLDDAKRQLDEAKRRHRRDISLISDKFVEFANENTVSEEYDDMVEYLNPSLLFPLSKTERDFTITETWTVTRTSTFTARSEEDAIEMAEESRVYNVEDLASDGWYIDGLTRDDVQAEEA